MIIKDIINTTIENGNFRTVLYTGQNSQVVVMSLKKGEDIGAEVHQHTDQILVIVKGWASTIIDDREEKVGEGDIVCVPAGKSHNIINSGDSELKLYTVYSPPQHPDGTIHKTKEEALIAEEKEH